MWRNKEIYNLHPHQKARPIMQSSSLTRLTMMPSPQRGGYAQLWGYLSGEELVRPTLGTPPGQVPTMSPDRNRCKPCTRVGRNVGRQAHKAKKPPVINHRLQGIWRRGWDSNPRYGVTVRLISSQVHSTTLPPLRVRRIASRVAHHSMNQNAVRRCPPLPSGL